MKRIHVFRSPWPPKIGGNSQQAPPNFGGLGGREAQTLVEFAFVLPILLLLMVALIDFGIIMHAQIVVTHAAWEGARAGATIVNPTEGDQEIIGAVHQASFGLNLDELLIDIDPEQDEAPRNQAFPAPRGAPLTVIVSYNIRLTFPGIDVPVTGKAVTRMEYHNP